MPTCNEFPHPNAKKIVVATLSIVSAMSASFMLGRAWESKFSASTPPITKGIHEGRPSRAETGAPDDGSRPTVLQNTIAASSYSPKQEVSDIGATRRIGVAPGKTAAALLAETFGALAATGPTGNSKAFANPLAGWHQQFAAEKQDADWSGMAQSQAEAYLSDKSSPNIELISVRCGSTVCEIQAASASAEDSETAASEWQSNVSAMSAESWWSTYGFATPNSAIFSAPDGRALMVTYITRSTSTVASNSE